MDSARLPERRSPLDPSRAAPAADAERAFRAAQDAWVASQQAYAAYHLQPRGPESDRARREFMATTGLFMQRVRELTAALELQRSID